MQSEALLNLISLIWNKSNVKTFGGGVWGTRGSPPFYSTFSKSGHTPTPLLLLLLKGEHFSERKKEG